MSLTVFSVPKPFTGHIRTIQRNAIRSWQALDVASQVILCGDEPGCREVVAELHLDHIPEVATTEHGTPLLSSVFELVEQRARNDVLCYTNADLVFFSDFTDAVRHVASACGDFLLVGQTTNVGDGVAEDADARQALRERALTSGTVRGSEWIDFFVFRRGRLGSLPDFAVGRPFWDNWLIWHARSMRIAVVDITPSAMVVHQEHGYEHIPESAGPRWEGPEADRNRELLGHPGRALWIDDCTHQLTRAGIVPYTGRGRLHRLATELQLRPWGLGIHRVLRRAYRRVRDVLGLDGRPG